MSDEIERMQRRLEEIESEKSVLKSERDQHVGHINTAIAQLDETVGMIEAIHPTVAHAVNGYRQRVERIKRTWNAERHTLEGELSRDGQPRDVAIASSLGRIEALGHDADQVAESIAKVMHLLKEEDPDVFSDHEPPTEYLG